MYSKVPGQSVFQAILCGVEEMPTQTDGHFCPDVSSTPLSMAWNILCPFTLEYTFCVVYLAPMCGVEEPIPKCPDTIVRAIILLHTK